MPRREGAGDAQLIESVNVRRYNELPHPGIGQVGRTTMTDRSMPAVTRLALTLLIAAGPATGCIWTRTHSPIAEGTQLSVTDAKTGQPVQDVDVFLHATVKARGWGFMAESFWRDVFCRYEGRHRNPIVVPRRKHRVWHYNFLIRGKNESSCHLAVILYKRGYFTASWLPRKPTEVKMLRIDSPGAGSRTGESEIDCLLRWAWSWRVTPNGGHRRWMGDVDLRKEAARHGAGVKGRSAFKRVICFAIDEYKALLKGEAIDDTTRTRLKKKIADLANMVE
jgi:hypothetical protein